MLATKKSNPPRRVHIPKRAKYKGDIKAFFQDILVSVLIAAMLLSTLPVYAVDSGQVPPEDRSRYAYFVETAPGGKVGIEGSPEAILTVFNEYIKGDGKSLVTMSDTAKIGDADLAKLKTLMSQLYTEAAKGGGNPHKKVAMVISNELPDSATSKQFNDANYAHRDIPENINVLMGRARDLLIQKTIMKVAKANKWHVARSDTGNLDSGMRSDLDQTFFLFEYDEDGNKVRVTDDDTRFIEAFGEAWDGKHGDLPLKSLDVVIIEDSNRFPDPRNTSIGYLAVGAATSARSSAGPGE